MATWNGVITNAGNSLLNEWVNEKTLNFDSAAAGQGTVAAAAMMAQTALVNEKQTASLLGGERVSSGIRLKLRIAAPNTAYTLNQFRVSASVDGGASAMIALFQLEQGVPIPSKTESPDFVYTFLRADLLLEYRHMDGDGRHQRLRHAERYVRRHR